MRKWWRRLRLVVHVRRFLPFLVEFFASREVPMRKKAFSVGLFLLYMVLPFDLIPDWLALFGFIDDFAVFMFILQQVIKMAPVSLKEKYNL
ncbi:YkvA family protein [Geobacillus stearothermophilus]|uniref:YkvA family protein n=1 Tax=Geobacillus stearothermophilus TaxID=1422 RepID=UPI003D2571FC